MSKTPFYSQTFFGVARENSVSSPTEKNSILNLGYYYEINQLLKTKFPAIKQVRVGAGGNTTDNNDNDNASIIIITIGSTIKLDPAEVIATLSEDGVYPVNFTDDTNWIFTEV